jgi:hypothetical protein
VPITDWKPSLADVGALLRARTVDKFGNELGTWTVDTRPTADEAQAMIDQAAGETIAEHGDPDVPTDSDPTQMYAILKSETAYTAALKIELTYFPEQVAAGRSPYPAMLVQRDRLSVLAGKAIQELSSGGQVGEADDARLPQWDFPIQGNGMVGWGTKW